MPRIKSLGWLTISTSFFNILLVKLVLIEKLLQLSCIFYFCVIFSYPAQTILSWQFFFDKFLPHEFVSKDQSIHNLLFDCWLSVFFDKPNILLRFSIFICLSNRSIFIKHPKLIVGFYYST